MGKAKAKSTKKNLWPCGSCQSDCGNGSIMCETCSKWFHRECQNISVSDLQLLNSLDSVPYICIACANTGNDEFDYFMGLMRLVQASKEGIGKLQMIAKRENLLLKSPLKQFSPPTEVKCDIDYVCSQLFSRYKFTKAQVPLSTTPDGNCLFNAVSLCLVGDESMSVELRYRCCLEMINNKSRYLEHPEAQRIVEFAPEYDDAVIHCSKLGSAGSPWTIIALSNVIGREIKCLYPPVEGKDDPLFKAFNMTCKPLNSSNSNNEQITISFCSVTLPKEGSKIWNPNHFIAVVPASVLSEKSDKEIQPTIYSNVIKASTPINSKREKRRPLYLSDFVPDIQKSQRQKQLKKRKKQNPLPDMDNNLSPINCEVQSSSDNLNVAEYNENENEQSANVPSNECTVPAVDTSMTLYEQISESDENHSSEREEISHTVDDDDSVHDDNLNIIDQETACFPLPSSKFMTCHQLYQIIMSRENIQKEVPECEKTNVYILVDFTRNKERLKNGQKCEYYDNCGVWNGSKGTTSKTDFQLNEQGQLKAVVVKNGSYCFEKVVGGTKTFVPIDPQPDGKDIVTMHRAYSTLKQDSNYRRRVTYVTSGSDRDISGVALFEYCGTYPTSAISHGNSKHQSSEYVRTKPKVLETIASKSKYMKPREIYKEMVKDDSFNAPKSFKQCRNVVYNTKKSHQVGGVAKGSKTNIADEILEAISMVGNHPFVREVNITKNKTPTFVLMTEEQKIDLQFFLSQNSSFALGIDRTFNLGRYFVTALVYKNLRIVRAENLEEHPIFLGPVFLHRDATFESYHYFLSTVKATLCTNNLKSVNLRLGKEVYIGSDDECAMTKAIESVFPSATRLLCTKHLKDNTASYLQKEVGVPPKERHTILDSIFGQDGLVNADDSLSFDEKSLQVVKTSSNFPQFLSYYNKRLKSRLLHYVNAPSREVEGLKNWTNNNCESLNNIMKVDANWKPQSTPDLINMLFEITELHFKDFRRALYGSGNYRLHRRFIKFSIRRIDWQVMDDDKKKETFIKFLQNKRKTPEENVVYSTFADFSVPSMTIAKKPGQRKRPRRERTEKRKC